MPITISMPSLSPTMTEGNLAKWLKKEGDVISVGDIIAEVETDKATMEVEAVDGGTLGKILIPAGTQAVKVNQPIAILLKKGETVADIKNTDYGTPVIQAKVETLQQQANITKQSFSSNNKNSETQKVTASPLAKRIAADNNIDLTCINGTGPHGRIVRDDVLLSTASNISITHTPKDKTIPHTNIRKIIAKRLLESKQTIPHFYLSSDCVIDNLLKTRDHINAEAKLHDGKPEYKVSINDLAIKACASALRKVPEANCSWTEDSVQIYGAIDISVAVSIDGGLITPIIRNADKKSVIEISKEMKILAKKAKDGKLQPHEFQGGSFSVSNLGMFGVKEFKAIVNPPQSAILAIGATVKTPIVDANNTISIGNVLTISISCDHRVIDGVLAAVLLGAIKDRLEKPYLLLV